MLRSVPGVTPARQAQRLHDRQKDPAGAGGNGRNRRSQQRLTEHETVSQPERRGSEQLDELVSDPVAEPGLDEPAGEEEGEGDEPGDGVTEGGEGGGKRQRFGQNRGSEAQKSHGAQGKRLGDDSDNGGEKNGE